MYLPDVLQDNLRFLVLEVQRQIERTHEFWLQPSPEARKTLLSRDDYIDNLKTYLQRACFDNTHEVEPEYARALTVASANLERIADFCGNILRQFSYVTREELFREYDFDPFFEVVLETVPLCEKAILERDIHTALKVCRAEPRLDELYSQAFKSVLDALEAGGHPQTNVTILFVLHYFERMGDALLNVGEAVISASLGERVKIGQLWALEETLDESVGRTVQDVDLHRMGQTRSGCSIVRIDDPDREGVAQPLIFKEGESSKLAAEKDGIERFEALMPGIAPRVLSWQPHGAHSALLFEYLPGKTLEELVLGGTAEQLAEGVGALLRFLPRLWDETRRAEPARANFMKQTRDRLGDVFDLHPEFEFTGGSIGDLHLPSLRELVDSMAELERELCAPFSVLIHGDCNADNIICGGDADRVRYIDLHRSCLGDYCQDLSVFMVSNYRLQVFETPVRRRIRSLIGRVQRAGIQYAEEHGDRTFQARLTLGLVRSLLTSSRFVLDVHFARALVMRAEFLMHRLLRHPRAHMDTFTVPWETFS